MKKNEKTPRRASQILRKQRTVRNLSSLYKLPALYIGRFQPFHLGHLDAVKQILRKEKSLIIAIGSAQYSRLPENPFSADEREKMIKAALKEAGISAQKYKILPVKNIEDYSKWPAHVDKTLPPYGTVYTGSKIVKNLYEKYGCHNVKNVKFNIKISATICRKID